jgi:hypothetical protein
LARLRGRRARIVLLFKKIIHCNVAYIVLIQIKKSIFLYTLALYPI